MASYWETVTVDGQNMATYLSVPEGDGPFPAVVLPPHNGGVDSWHHDLTRRMAEAGFVTACLDLYYRDPVDSTESGRDRFNRLRSDNVIKDVRATVEFLKSYPGVDGDRLGVIGWCGGGQVAYMVATAIPEFKAACLYHPGHLFDTWADGAVCFDRSADLKCPLLAHFGEHGTAIPMKDVARLDAELTRLGKSHEFYTYPYATTGFMAYHRTEIYHAPSDRASWPRTVAFFEKYLGKVQAGAA